MKEIYLVYTGGGQYEDYCETLHATFETREEAETWAEDNLATVKDWTALYRMYDEWCDTHLEWDVYDEDSDGTPEEAFVKDHPEYTVDDLYTMQSDTYGRDLDTIIVYRLTPGVPADVRLVSSRYIYNPNRDTDRPPEHWMRRE